VTAITFYTEIIDINRFANLDKLAALWTAVQAEVTQNQINGETPDMRSGEGQADAVHALDIRKARPPSPAVWWGRPSAMLLGVLLLMLLALPQAGRRNRLRPLL